MTSKQKGQGHDPWLSPFYGEAFWFCRGLGDNNAFIDKVIVLPTKKAERSPAFWISSTIPRIGLFCSSESRTI